MSVWDDLPDTPKPKDRRARPKKAKKKVAHIDEYDEPDETPTDKEDTTGTPENPSVGHSISPEFMEEIHGNWYVKYAGVLDLAHQMGLQSIETEYLGVFDEVHLFKAVVTMEDERTFTGYGDAGPDSVKQMVRPHIIRVAETRAKARALRDAVNIGMAAVEELAE